VRCPLSPRARFLTCEHQGCLEFEENSRSDYLTTPEAATPIGFFRSGKRNWGGGVFAPSAEPDFLCTRQRDQGVESIRAELEQRLRERWPTWFNLEANLSPGRCPLASSTETAGSIWSGYCASDWSRSLPQLKQRLGAHSMCIKSKRSLAGYASTRITAMTPSPLSLKLPCLSLFTPARSVQVPAGDAAQVGLKPSATNTRMHLESAFSFQTPSSIQ